METSSNRPMTPTNAGFVALPEYAGTPKLRLFKFPFLDFCMHALVFGKARVAARTLLARAGGVFMWPGIALTERRCAACVPRGGCRAVLDQPAA